MPLVLQGAAERAELGLGLRQCGRAGLGQRSLGGRIRGRLLPRGTPGAVIESLEQAIAQVRRLALHGEVVASDGTVVRLRADTLCLHGDRNDAADFARALRKALQADGIAIAAIGADA